jgi:hypothetical protein
MEFFQNTSRISVHKDSMSLTSADLDSLVVDNPVGLFGYSDMTMVDEKHLFLSRFDGEDVSLHLEQYAALHGLDNELA